MRASAGRVLVVAAACLWIVGCETSTKLTGLFGSSDPADIPPPPPNASAPGEPPTTGTVATTQQAEPVDAATPRLLGKDPNDDLSLGKKYFRSANFGLAEQHFRRAAEQHPRDVESWVGLAASYDRLKRFDLADRAYAQAITVGGETPEIMNNRGFSYLLRGDYVRARRTLMAAQARAPDNPYIRNNLQLLEKVERRRKGVN
jgi:Flp pilus assembly protein TadD